METNGKQIAGPVVSRVEKGVSLQRGQTRDGYKPSKPADAVQPKPVVIPPPPATNGSKTSNG
jgi:hypothetical protein